ncbi:MAG: hypothetical protein V5A37_01660 [Halobacteriales archaeon]
MTDRPTDGPNGEAPTRADGGAAEEASTPGDAGRSRVLSRALVTWVELTAVGIAGGVVGTNLGGPPGFIVYMLTTLVSVAVLFHNVDALVERKRRGNDG